jgi:hypothetical protein
MGGEYVMVLGREKTSKPGSLKKNYGGVSVHRVRKPIRRKEEENEEG